MSAVGTRQRQALDAGVAYALLALACALVLTPFVWLVTSSLKSREDFFTSMFLPTGEGVLGIAWGSLTLGNFTTLFDDLGFHWPLLNSIFIASASSLLATACCAAAGYALAVYRFKGRGAVMFGVLVALVLPPQLLLAPTYQLLYRLDLLDTFVGLILPTAAPAFGVFLFRQATLSSVPKGIIEAARIDGAGEVRIFLTVAAPLLRPMISAFVLISFLGMWNNFIWPQVVLQNADRFPLSVEIAQLRGVYYQDYGLVMAATLVSIAPIAILFLVLQREFISGLTAGAVKG